MIQTCWRRYRQRGTLRRLAAEVYFKICNPAGIVTHVYNSRTRRAQWKAPRVRKLRLHDLPEMPAADCPQPTSKFGWLEGVRMCWCIGVGVLDCVWVCMVVCKGVFASRVFDSSQRRRGVPACVVVATRGSACQAACGSRVSSDRGCGVLLLLTARAN